MLSPPFSYIYNNPEPYEIRYKSLRVNCCYRAVWTSLQLAAFASAAAHKNDLPPDETIIHVSCCAAGSSNVSLWYTLLVKSHHGDRLYIPRVGMKMNRFVAV